MLACLIVGAVFTVVTVGIHSVGTAWWIGCLKCKQQHTPTGLAARLMPIKLLCSTALVLLVLHLAEAFPWALLYMNLPSDDAINTFEEAVYFATVTFASLGYGDVVLSGPWRALSAMQAMNGLLVFGWSTALLFAVVQRIWGDESENQLNPSENDQTLQTIRQFG